MIESFPCTACGACCRHINLSPETQFLDRGDGICRHYDLDTKLCSIYESRPDICRVDLGYQQRYSSIYTWEEYLELNLKACSILQNLG